MYCNVYDITYTTYLMTRKGSTFSQFFFNSFFFIYLNNCNCLSIDLTINQVIDAALFTFTIDQ